MLHTSFIFYIFISFILACILKESKIMIQKYSYFTFCCRRGIRILQHTWFLLSKWILYIHQYSICLCYEEKAPFSASGHAPVSALYGYRLTRYVARLYAVFASFSPCTPDKMERSFVMVKPDGVQRALVGEVVTRFENRGYKLVASKMLWVCYFLID